MRYTDKGVEGLKVAYVGGGSRGWAWGLMSDLANCDDMSGNVYLYDIDHEAAKTNEIIGNKSAGSNTIKNVGSQVVGILQTVGIVLSVVVLIVLGIKYMMGSTEEKSEYKKTFIPYIVGAALIFAASVFATAIYDFFSNMSAG